MPQRTQQNVHVMQRQDQTQADQCWEELVKHQLPASRAGLPPFRAQPLLTQAME